MSASKIFRDGLLANQVALVTGGGTGIGKAIAFELARLGADVAIASRKRENVEPVAAAIATSTGRRADWATCDTREPEQVSAMVSKVEAALGGITILVNNAGGQFPAPAESYTIKGWNAVVNNNLNGVWYVTQAIATRMIARGAGGRVISITAHYHGGMPGIAHSSAARAAVRNLTKTLAVEWARHGIRVNSVAPGTIATEAFHRVYDAETKARRLAEQPLGRFGSPEDVAYAVAYLASPAGDFVTGEEIVVHGGERSRVWTIPEIK